MKQKSTFDRAGEMTTPEALLVQRLRLEADSASHRVASAAADHESALSMQSDVNNRLHEAMWAHIVDMEKRAAKAESERDAIREAAQALVDALESTHGDWPRFCDAPRCCCLAMHDDGDQVACDEHQGMLVDGDVEDLSYAPALRTLRALLEGGGS